MKDFEERKAEVLRRSALIVKKRKQRRRAVLFTALIALILSGAAVLTVFALKKDVFRTPDGYVDVDMDLPNDPKTEPGDLAREGENPPFDESNNHYAGSTPENNAPSEEPSAPDLPSEPESASTGGIRLFVQKGHVESETDDADICARLPALFGEQLRSAEEVDCPSFPTFGDRSNNGCLFVEVRRSDDSVERYCFDGEIVYDYTEDRAVRADAGFSSRLYDLVDTLGIA